MTALMSTTRAHPAWSIAEVVREVMQHNDDNKGTLASCAQVSHAFSGPALEVLWRDMNGLGHLLAILRTSVIRTDSGEFEPLLDMPINKYVMTGPIDDAEWHRLQYYANLVRRYFTTPLETIESTLSKALSNKLADSPMFPRLTFLSWTQQDGWFVPFLSPMLRFVSVQVYGWEGPQRIEAMPTFGDHAIARLLKTVCARAPTLESLDMEACHICTLKPLSGFVNLRILSINHADDPRIWSHVAASLPSLRDLTVRMFSQPNRGNIPDDGTPALRLPETHFGQLTRLKLFAAQQYRMVPIILDSLRAPCLKHLHLETPIAEDDCVRTCAVVASRFSVSLRTLVLELRGVYWNRADPQDFDAVFSPLHAMHELEEVELQTSRDLRVVITADDVARMTEAWPNLTRLVLPYRRCSMIPLPLVLDEVEYNGPRMPVTALEMFARRCATLEKLVVPIPDPASLSNLDLATIPVYSNGLARLELVSGTWSQDVEEKGVRYVQKLFPKAQVLFDEDLVCRFSFVAGDESQLDF